MVRPNWLRPVRGSLRLVLLCLSLLLSLTLCLSVSVHSECSRTATPRHATQSTASASASGLDTLTTSRLAPCSTELQNCSTAPYRTGHHRTAPAERAAAMAGVCCPNPPVIGGPFSQIWSIRVMMSMNGYGCELHYCTWAVEH